MDYEPIPTPPHLVWREFKVRFLPPIIFAIVLLCALIVWKSRLGPDSILGEAESLRADLNANQPGVLTELKARTFQQVKAGETLGKIVGADPKNAMNLVAPIDGAITYLFAQTGDKVIAGQPVLTIVGNQPDRIVAYLRQPVRVEPVEGMKATVRPRARHGSAAEAQVVRVSPQLAPIPLTLLPGRELATEKGLPVILNVPAGLHLYPGEIVEVKLFSSGSPDSGKPKEGK